MNIVLMMLNVSVSGCSKKWVPGQNIGGYSSGICCCRKSANVLGMVANLFKIFKAFVFFVLPPLLFSWSLDSSPPREHFRTAGTDFYTLDAVSVAQSAVWNTQWNAKHRPQPGKVAHFLIHRITMPLLIIGLAVHDFKLVNFRRYWLIQVKVENGCNTIAHPDVI